MASAKKRLLLASGVVLLTLIVLAYFLYDRLEKGSDDYDHPLVVFDDHGLHETVVVPTLDTPMPENKSSIWCGSFQMAWNELTTKVVKEPIRLADAGDVAERLNAAKFTSADLIPGSFYSNAGFVRDGIVPEIKAAMNRQFPEVELPELGDGNVAIAYAYLAVSSPFTLPYFEDHLLFNASNGKQTKVQAFGIAGHGKSTPELRNQVAILFANPQHKEDPGEFAIDLCKDSTPIQVVVARVERKGSLAETFSHVQARIKESAAAKDAAVSFGDDRLLVPVMNWKINHHYSELEKKVFQNRSVRDLYIDKAFQTIQFKLDKNGADLKSEAVSYDAKSQSRHYHLDRPYLLYMKKRGADNAFLVMWIDNAELMAK